MDNFITAEEFLKQPKDIQKAFIDWWNPQIGDLATDRYSDIGVLQCQRDIEAVKIYKGKPYAIPLFQIHQLIKFIEDKTEAYVSINVDRGKYVIVSDSYYGTDEENLLKALFEVACKIAMEE